MECNESGYRGRLGIFEVLKIDQVVRDTLLTTPTEAAVSLIAVKNKMVTMRQAGIMKAKRGETTFEEVLRVT